MCGIWGRISKGEGNVATFEQLESAFVFIAGRGPDARGAQQNSCFGHSVVLAHTRRSIIELSNLGAQPMLDPGSGWWVSFNGEIYNYLEIRTELRNLGHTFSGGSDTEVLLRAWALWGLDALNRFNGMFAFAAFNEGTGELWLVRDRFGVKPLAWGYAPEGGLVFSSSVAAVATQVGGEIDTAYCARGVRYKTYETADSGSPFKHVKSVPAGCWTKIQLSHDGLAVTEGRWYCLEKAVSTRRTVLGHIGDAQLIEECRALFDSTVSLRLRSDVPVALSLSSGLDSTSIAGVMSRHITQLRGFTFGSPSVSASEGPGTAAFADAAGIDVTYVWPKHSGRDLCDALERTMSFQEAPFSGLSPIAQNEIFRAVSEAGFKVLLGGQGSDEIFAGYRKFFVVALRDALFRREAKDILRMFFSLGMMLAHEASQARMYWQNRDRYRRSQASAFQLLDWESRSENLWGDASMSLSERQIKDVQQWSIPTLLRYEDRNSMGYGVETRLPFMDYRIIEFALALPARMKISNGYGKWALRSISAGQVPDSIRLNRKKRGFDVTADWIGHGLGASLRGRIFGNLTALSGTLKSGVELDALLSDASLAQHPNLLDEALMLAWMADPIRRPTSTARQGRGA